MDGRGWTRLASETCFLDGREEAKLGCMVLTPIVLTAQRRDGLHPKKDSAFYAVKRQGRGGRTLFGTDSSVVGGPFSEKREKRWFPRALGLKGERPFPGSRKLDRRSGSENWLRAWQGGGSTEFYGRVKKEKRAGCKGVLAFNFFFVFAVLGLWFNSNHPNKHTFKHANKSSRVARASAELGLSGQ